MLKNKGVHPSMRVTGRFPFSRGKRLRLPISYLWEKLVEAHSEGDKDIEIMEVARDGSPVELRVHGERWQIESGHNPQVVTRVKRIGLSSVDHLARISLSSRRVLKVTDTTEFETVDGTVKAKSVTNGGMLVTPGGRRTRAVETVLGVPDGGRFVWLQTNTGWFDVEGVRAFYREG